MENPTDDSVEVAIAFLKEVGQKLTEVSGKGINAIFEMLKNILHEGKLDKRVQYMIEVVFQIRKDGFKDHVAVIDALELVEEDDQFTHLIMLDEATDTQDILSKQSVHRTAEGGAHCLIWFGFFFADVFKVDPEYEVNETKYKEISREILGSDAEDDEDGDKSGDSSSGDSDDSDDDEADSDSDDGDNAKQKQDTIIDNTETNLIALRRTIYLTIHSSLDYEECAHKLMKMELKPGQEQELCHMFLDCCAEQRTYEKFYGLLAQRFCMINKIYIAPFEQIFHDTYTTTHRLDTNRLRNVSKFFAHLLFTDSIGWDVLQCIRLNEEDTTSSSRIFIKILFQELAEYMGLFKLNARLKDPTLQEPFSGLFPRDNPKNTRFAINYFTSIGLGGLTDELREFLKHAPKPVVQPLPAPVASSGSSDSDSSSSDSDSDSTSSDSSSSSSSDSDSDSSSSESEKEASKRKRRKNKEKESMSKKKKSEKQKQSDKKTKHKRDDRADKKEKHRKRAQEEEEEEEQDNRKEKGSRRHEKHTAGRYPNEHEDRSQRRRDDDTDYDRSREKHARQHREEPPEQDVYNRRERDRDQERDRDRGRDRGLDRERDRDRERERERGQDRERERERERDRERVPNRIREQYKDHDREYDRRERDHRERRQERR